MRMRVHVEGATPRNMHKSATRIFWQIGTSTSLLPAGGLYLLCPPIMLQKKMVALSPIGALACFREGQARFLSEAQSIVRTKERGQCRAAPRMHPAPPMCFQATDAPRHCRRSMPGAQPARPPRLWLWGTVGMCSGRGTSSLPFFFVFFCGIKKHTHKGNVVR